MGIIRTSFAWLVASLTVGLVSGLPHVTLANDVGPGKEVRAIRRDLPVLLPGEQQLSGPVRVDAVITTGDEAMARWHDAQGPSRAYLVRKFGRWWFQNVYAAGCNPYGSQKMEKLWDAYLDTLPTPTPPPASGTNVVPIMRAPVPSSCDLVHTPDLAFNTGRQEPTDTGGYEVRVAFPTNDAPKGARIATFSGRAPSEAESWMTNGGNSYFFFSGTVHSDAPIHVDAGTTIDVWFPFVLDTSLHYAVTIAHADKPIGPIDGTLKDNVVHFVLPAFTLAPGAELRGEIEGDAWPHYSGP